MELLTELVFSFRSNMSPIGKIMSISPHSRGCSGAERCRSERSSQGVIVIVTTTFRSSGAEKLAVFVFPFLSR
jgi:hypothetical protein